MAPEWRHGSILEAIMGVSLSIKDVPEALAARLRQRAARNHRSLQRELMALVEAAAAEPLRPVDPGLGADPAIRSGEPPAGYTAAAVPGGSDAPASAATQSSDDLLTELDRIVQGSAWAQAPLLDRERLHDRALARELDFDCREAELRQARAGSTARRA
jgi:plasmid stability protein